MWINKAFICINGEIFIFTSALNVKLYCKKCHAYRKICENVLVERRIIKLSETIIIINAHVST